MYFPFLCRDARREHRGPGRPHRNARRRAHLLKGGHYIWYIRAFIRASMLCVVVLVLSRLGHSFFRRRSRAADARARASQRAEKFLAALGQGCDSIIQKY